METSTDSAAMRSIPDAVAGGGAGEGIMYNYQSRLSDHLLLINVNQKM